MILVTGGACQGKTDVAVSLFRQKMQAKEEKNPLIADGAADGWQQLGQAEIIIHFHLWIQRLIKEGSDPLAMSEKLIQENADVIITLDQIGCGVVPQDSFDRRYREASGRAGCFLARNAREVYLVNFGIAKRIK